MELARRDNWGKTYYLAIINSFLIWSLTLIVCFLVVGFPLVVIMMAFGALFAITLQSVLPVSAALVVGGGIIGSSLLAVFATAGLLTFKGIHPQEVSWLHWLHGDASPLHQPVYAACPLTCNLQH